MELTATKRVKEKKKDAKRIRREGQIPAVLYSTGKETELVSVSGREIETLLRNIRPGHLATCTLSLDLDGKKRKVIIKDIHYNPTTYRMIHLDFEELFESALVNVNVPIVPIGVMECAGIKLGGFLRQVIRSMKVKCLPKNIPENFEIDVRDLGIRQSKRLSDIHMPEGVIPLVQLSEVAVVIAKR